MRGSEAGHSSEMVDAGDAWMQGSEAGHSSEMVDAGGARIRGRASEMGDAGGARIMVEQTTTRITHLGQ